MGLFDPDDADYSYPVPKPKAPTLSNALWDMLRSLRHGDWKVVRHGEGLGRANKLLKLGLVRKQEYIYFSPEFCITQAGLDALALKER